MANCFENLISYRGQCDNSITPISGLYLDQIGIHKSEMEQYFAIPYQNVDNFFTDQYNMAIDNIQKAIYSNFLPAYRSTSIIDNSRIGYVQDNMIVKTGNVNKYRGIEVEICQHQSALNFYLSEFSLFIDTTATVTIKVYDLNQNTQIDSFTIDAVANTISKAYPKKTYTSNRSKLNLAFVYDSTLYDSYQTDILGTSCNSCSNTTYTNVNGYIRSQGLELGLTDSFLPENLTSLSHTSGISIIYSLSCNHKEWICSSAELLASALLYKTAYNIMIYAQYSSDRNNHRTNDNINSLVERAKYYDFMYNNEIKNILNNIQPPNDSLCYECNNRIKTVMSV